MVLRKTIVDFNADQMRAAEKLIQVLTCSAGRQVKDKAECIVFSMDRAMQFHALLGSYICNVTNPPPIHVLYRATSKSHDLAYHDVLNEYQSIIKSVTKQTGKATFRKQLLEILAIINTEKILFLVDDDLFIEKFDFQELATLDATHVIPSFRMGANLRESYTQQKEQPLPLFFRQSEDAMLPEKFETPITRENRDDFLYWTWNDGSQNWAYPLSVDGHLFNRGEIIGLAELTEFNSPNTFESNLQRYNIFFRHRFGLCYRKSRMLNVPCNKVQTDNDNIHGDMHQDDLLAKWQQGFCIDYRALCGFYNKSAHQEIPFTFISRQRPQ